MTDRRSGTSHGNSPDDQDAQLLWQAAARAEAVLEDLAAGRSPASELSALLGYLREVVLARISEEERHVFPTLRRADAPQSHLDRLHRDHLLPREDINDLAAAAAAHGASEPDQLIAVTRRLIHHIEEHLRTEAAALVLLPGGFQASPSGWTRAQHWYPLTEGPLIDMHELIDVHGLRPDEADDAVLNRLAQLRGGEHVELHGHGDPQRLWRRLQRRAPSEYSWSEHHDPKGWIVSIARRPAA